MKKVLLLLVAVMAVNAQVSIDTIIVQKEQLSSVVCYDISVYLKNAPKGDTTYVVSGYGFSESVRDTFFRLSSTTRGVSSYRAHGRCCNIKENKICTLTVGFNVVRIYNKHLIGGGYYVEVKTIINPATNVIPELPRKELCLKAKNASFDILGRRMAAITNSGLYVFGAKKIIGWKR